MEERFSKKMEIMNKNNNRDVRNEKINKTSKDHSR
jgi:hypothetical protein